MCINNFSTFTKTKSLQCLESPFALKPLFPEEFSQSTGLDPYGTAGIYMSGEYQVAVFCWHIEYNIQYVLSTTSATAKSSLEPMSSLPECLDHFIISIIARVYSLESQI